MYFPVVVYWCQCNWLSASLIKFLLESKFAAKNAKTSSSSQGSLLGNNMKLGFNSNLTVNEAAPLCVSSLQIGDVDLLCLTLGKTGFSLTASCFWGTFYLKLGWKFKIQVLNGFFPIQTYVRGELKNVPILFWKDCCQKLFGSSRCQIHPKTLQTEWGWINAAG